MRRDDRAALLLLVPVLALPASGSAAELRPAALFGDGMVIQRHVPVPVWGWAAAAAEVVVTLDGRAHSTRADAAGRWRVELPPRPAGGPFDMKIEAAGEELRVRDLMVGDVWLCSGQSNMEWVVRESLDAATVIAAAEDRSIRHFKVPRSWAAAPETTLAGGVWEAADGEHVGDFTAAGYFFARALRPRLVGVPIGLINATWGGSRIEAWMSAAALGLDDEGVRQVLARERLREQEVLRRIEAQAGGLPDRDRGFVDGRARWADPQLDDSYWHEIEVPSLWEEDGWEGMDGIGWYRTSFQLTAAEAAAGIRLGLGTIDDSDISWVNGHRVGGTELAWNRPRLYEVPSEPLAAGRNVIAVRVEDTGGGGGIYGDPDLLFVEVAGARRPLAGTWRFQLGAVSLNLEDRKREVPTMLFNKMVHPLLPFPVRGILWYQGESNAGPADAYAYRRLFQAMIGDWRRRWGIADLPFLFAQLAAFMPPPEEPGESDWALLRESQSAVLALPNTAQVVLIDAGEAEDVHPRDKQVVGERLALAARKVAYGEEVVFSGPVYSGHEVRDGRVILEFDHIGGGLVAKDAPRGGLAGFAVAGADRHFVWAEARLEGDRVVVWSDLVPDPVAVRYGWADNPEGANLYNREGLPASPFRTDDWRGDVAAEGPGPEDEESRWP
jgi:sialate O-acetylesterase